MATYRLEHRREARHLEIDKADPVVVLILILKLNACLKCRDKIIPFHLTTSLPMSSTEKTH